MLLEVGKGSDPKNMIPKKWKNSARHRSATSKTISIRMALQKGGKETKPGTTSMGLLTGKQFKYIIQISRIFVSVRNKHSENYNGRLMHVHRGDPLFAISM